MKTNRKALHFLTYILCLSAWVECCSPHVHAQQTAPVQIVANVELVRIPVIVFNDKGAVATDLTKNDFRLFDDGVEQNILYYEREREPVSFVILADLSSSMTNKIPFVQDAALSLLDSPEEQDKYHDEYSLFGVGKRSKLLLPFTNDQKDLERRLPLLLTATNESTSLFDGIWLGTGTAQREAVNQHHAMIIITDGGDNHSRYNLTETKRLLAEADMPVFAVMAGPSFELPAIFLPQEKKRKRSPTGREAGPQLPTSLMTAQDDYIGPAERRGPRNMKVLTEITGGGVFTARDEEDLPRIVRTIGLAVRYRYILTYKPTHEQVHEQASKTSQENAAEGHGTHKIHLELYPKEKFARYSVPYYKRSYHNFE